MGFATQPKSVLSTVKLQSLAVQTTVIDFEEYSYSLSDVFGCNMCSKITVGYATQLKAVPSTVKIFAVYIRKYLLTFFLYRFFLLACLTHGVLLYLSVSKLKENVGIFHNKKKLYIL